MPPIVGKVKCIKFAAYPSGRSAVVHASIIPLDATYLHSGDSNETRH